MNKVYSKIGLSFSVSLAMVGGTAGVASATSNQSTTTHIEVEKESSHTTGDATHDKCDDRSHSGDETTTTNVEDDDHAKETECAPAPVIPESPMTVLLPIAGLTTVALTLQGRRRFVRRNLIGRTR